MSIFTQATASSLGAILDCDLSTGYQVVNGVVTTNPATDNTAILNAFLARGTADNPVELIIDGGSSVTGLFLPALGHASIVGLGWDTGFFMKAGSNQDCIHNGNATYSNVSATVIGQNVELRNFRINGNRGDGTTGNSNTGNPRGNSASTLWLFGIYLISLNNVRIEDVWVYAAPTYAVQLQNCSDVVVEGLRVEAPVAQFNTDGLHLSGSMSDVRVNNCYFQTGDDAIALNAPEGFGNGLQTRITISNCVFNNCPHALRAYTYVPGSTAKISQVVMINCTGNFTFNQFNYCAPILLGNNVAGVRSIDSINDITISNCNFTSQDSMILIADSCGTVDIDNVTWNGPNGGATNGSFFSFFGQANVSSLSVKNCKIYRNTAGNSEVTLLNNMGLNGVGGSILACSIGKFLLAGFNVDNETGQTYAPVPNLLKMTSITIAELDVDAVDPTFVTALADSFTNITTIRGAGVAASGFQIPDANVAANTLYISATSPNAGKLCIQHTLGTVVALG
jgi:hypothetical protein